MHRCPGSTSDPLVSTQVCSGCSTCAKCQSVWARFVYVDVDLCECASIQIMMVYIQCANRHSLIEQCDFVTTQTHTHSLIP